MDDALAFPPPASQEQLPSMADAASRGGLELKPLGAYGNLPNAKRAMKAAVTCFLNMQLRAMGSAPSQMVRFSSCCIHLFGLLAGVGTDHIGSLLCGAEYSPHARSQASGSSAVCDRGNKGGCFYRIIGCDGPTWRPQKEEKQKRLGRLASTDMFQRRRVHICLLMCMWAVSFAEHLVGCSGKGH